MNGPLGQKGGDFAKTIVTFSEYMNFKKKNSKVQKLTINLWVLKFTAVFKIPIMGFGGYRRVSEGIETYDQMYTYRILKR